MAHSVTTAIPNIRAVPPRAVPEFRTSEAQAEAAPRGWLLPGVDEHFRGIYTQANVEAPMMLAICSAISGEGKTTMSLGLAVTIAQDFPQRRVLLVEANLEHPVLAQDFGLEPEPGLADCLADGAPVQLAYRPTWLGNLDLLPAGRVIGSHGRLLRSTQMETAMDRMRQTHDIVILDAPALLTSSDALHLTSLAEGVIFVIRAGVTPSSLATKALNQIDHEKLRGIVLNGTQSSIPGPLRRLFGL